VPYLQPTDEPVERRFTRHKKVNTNINPINHLTYARNAAEAPASLAMGFTERTESSGMGVES